jgi:hypothetical protein
MATFLEENRNGEMRKKEAKNGRKSGASASRQAWKAQKDKTRIACGLRSSLGFFAESIFSAEDIKTTYASTRLRLYPYKDVRSRLSQQVTAQNGVGVVGVLLQRLYRFSGRKNQQFDLAPLGFSLHVVHHRESAVSAGANYQALALPRNSSLIESGVCLNASRNFLDAFFLPLADVFTIDHHIVLMSDAVDPDRAESKVFETH